MGLPGRGGLPGTAMFHPRFEAHHRPVADGQLTAECDITRPVTNPPAVTFDEVAGRSVYPEPAALYSGPCRVYARTREANPPSVGDRQVTIREYRIVLTASDPDQPEIRINDQVRIRVCDGDPALLGHLLRVTDVERGSVTWQRDLTCEDLEPTTR